jgi:hypothetical protein
MGIVRYPERVVQNEWAAYRPCGSNDLRFVEASAAGRYSLCLSAWKSTRRKAFSDTGGGTEHTGGHARFCAGMRWPLEVG